MDKIPLDTNPILNPLDRIPWVGQNSPRFATCSHVFAHVCMSNGQDGKRAGEWACGPASRLVVNVRTDKWLGGLEDGQTADGWAGWQQMFEWMDGYAGWWVGRRGNYQVNELMRE